MLPGLQSTPLWALLREVVRNFHVQTAMKTHTDLVQPPDILKSSVADLIDARSEFIVQGTVPARYGMQTTGATMQNGSTTQDQFDTRLGLFADFTGNVSSVQDFMVAYINNVGEGIDLQDMEGGEAPVLTSVTILGSPIVSNTTSSSRSLQPRASCRDIQVLKDDSCASLASRCGISGSDFTKYNSKTSNMCVTLKPKQYVCCSQGDLPNHTPQPNADGMCLTRRLSSQQVFRMLNVSCSQPTWTSFWRITTSMDSILIGSILMPPISMARCLALEQTACTISSS
jgi:hypothetical protein